METKKEKSSCAQFCDCLHSVITNVKKLGQNYSMDKKFGNGPGGDLEHNGHQEFNDTGMDSERDQKKSES